MIKKPISLFTKEKWKPEKIWIYQENGDLTWREFENRTIASFRNFSIGSKIRVGHAIDCEMESGKIARFKVVKIDGDGSPYFIRVKETGYVTKN